MNVWVNRYDTSWWGSNEEEDHLLAWIMHINFQYWMGVVQASVSREDAEGSGVQRLERQHVADFGAFPDYEHAWDTKSSNP